MRNIIDKTSGLLISLAIFISLAITYFYWQPYDKELFQPTFVIDKLYIFDFISRLIYYIIYFFALRIILSLLFPENDKLFDNVKYKAKYYTIMLCIRAAFDVLGYTLSRIIYEYKTSVFVIFLSMEALYNAVTIIAAAYILTSREIAGKSAKRTAAKIASAILFVLFIVFLVYQYCSCNSFYDEGINIWQSKLFICNATRDVLINFACICVLYSVLKHKSQFESCEPTFKLIVKTMVRIDLVILIFIFINFMKFIVLPHSLIKNVRDVNDVIVEINRIDSYSDAHSTEDDWF